MCHARNITIWRSQTIRRAACAMALLACLSAPSSAQDIDFRRDIRPIFSEKCFRCHGPAEDDREGGFRLDRKESAFGEADSGHPPIVAGSLGGSELVNRIMSDDPNEHMPPPTEDKQLTSDEIELLKSWIAQGADWDEHWAWLAPQSSAVPTLKVQTQVWADNAIDHFIGARLDSEGLIPAQRADKGTLLRRLAFDLTGLPPTMEDLEAFLADNSASAYEKMVDKYLASPHFGEHRARFWLDAVRYADTHGLHLDNYREMWPYRDWVVSAFNQNMPFDQFTTEQLAGDLLDDPTTQQLIASGYNRCHVTTNEGGSIEREVYIRNVVDRTVTTAMVFLGLTFDCARCHDHKYDPITAKDFYSLSAYFNSMDGSALDKNAKDPKPIVSIPSPEDQKKIDTLEERLSKLDDEIQQTLTQVEYVEPTDGDNTLRPTEWLWVSEKAPPAARIEGTWNYVHRPEPVFAGEIARVQAAPDFVQHFFETDATSGDRIAWTVAEGDTFFCYVLLVDEDRPEQLMLQFHADDWEHRVYWGANNIEFGNDKTPSRLPKGALPESDVWTRLEVSAEEVGLKPGDVINGWAFAQWGGKAYWDSAGILTRANPESHDDSLQRWAASQRLSLGGQLPEPVKSAVAAEERNGEQQRVIRDYFVSHVWRDARALFRPLTQERRALRKERDTLAAAAPTTLVYKELAKPRPAHVLTRGEYDKPAEEVPRGTPAMLPAFPTDAPNDRLGLAQWLVAPNHPLTARVTVNRLWQEFFGIGLVKTAEDFGSQGEPPSHPELLDWLAVQYMADGWDTKRLIKRIVMSSTYRQSSMIIEGMLQPDPENRLLARGPRYRLDAEMLRDQALTVSNLLQPQIGGPGVKPPQPAGLWKAVGYSGSNTVEFQADDDADKIHRRTIYTFWKRTAPPPQMSVFDAPSRESGCVRRERTNTALQALLLLNDPQYQEAAAGLADVALAEPQMDDRSRVDWMWRRCAMHEPTERQAVALMELLDHERSRFTEEPKLAAELMQQSRIKQTESDARERAAWTVVASVILNADEVVCKN